MTCSTCRCCELHMAVPATPSRKDYKMLSRTKHKLIGLLTASMTLVAAFVVTGGPILPGKAPIPDEVQSLANLSELKLEVIIPSAMLIHLESFSVSREMIRGDMENFLEENGVDIVEDGDVPTCTVVVTTNTLPDLPRVMGVTFHLSIEQVVFVKRIEKSLSVPTYALVHGIIVTHDDVSRDIRKTVPMLIQQLMRRMSQANRHLE